MMFQLVVGVTLISAFFGVTVSSTPVLEKCVANAHRESCASSCQTSCVNRFSYIEICNLLCNPNKCVCDEGFIWNADHTACIPPDSCCDGDVVCDEGFIFSPCGSHKVCEASDNGGCDSSGSNSSNNSGNGSGSGESKPAKCKKGCFCPKNKYFKAGQCVDKKQC